MFTSLNDKLPENAIITCDAGSTADWYGFHIKLGRNQMGNLSGRMASMMGMNGLLTVKRHWQEWDNPTFIVLVLDNGDLTQVSWEMRIAGDPRWDTAQHVEGMDYAGYAELLGFKGIRVEDPNTPPLPAHISFDQATGLAKSLLGGDPATGQVISQSLRSGSARLFERVTDSDH